MAVSGADSFENLLPFFSSLAANSRALYLGDQVARIKNPGALEFLRYVSQNKPVIIEDAVSMWPALTKWRDMAYLRSKMGQEQITVAVTPNGFADAIVDDKFFVTPEETPMAFNHFLDVLERGNVHSDGVHYVQLQNGNLKSEFKNIAGDVDEHLSFATEALGRLPEAVNFWMGDHHSVTSLHKDHYENIYVVITGEKHFTLYPPTDYVSLYETWYQKARYKRNPIKKNFEIILESPKSYVPWIAVDPLSADYERFPLFRLVKPLHVILKPGEMLYLPSLYYHHVMQKPDADCPYVTAVNFWYDMDYDIKYNYFQFMKNIADVCRNQGRSSF